MDLASQQRLRRNLDASSDDALVALANKGLLRRALKDLEKSSDPNIELTDTAIVVVGDQWRVSMPPEGPAHADDDSAATGITRHVLAATIFLRENWQPEESERGPENDRHETGDRERIDERSGLIEAVITQLTEASLDELSRWNGKTPVNEALARIQRVTDIRISRGTELSIAFENEDIRVLLISDRPARSLRRLLDQFKCTSRKSEHALWVMLAVMAIKREAGCLPDVRVLTLDQTDLATREDQERVARRIERLLTSIASSGIAHPSSRNQERLEAMRIAADAAKFPRAARLLQSIADDIRLHLARDAKADLQRLATRMATACALARGVSSDQQRTRGYLIGQSRTTYVNEGDVELFGLGAHHWRSASGFEGITVIFWDAAKERFLSVSQAREEGADRTFRVPQVYTSSSIWPGGLAIEKLCRSHVRLSDARCNEGGRLSTSEKCHVSALGDTQPEAIAFGRKIVTDWSELTEVAARSQAMGLRTPHPLDDLVIVQPSSWGSRWFHELDQMMVWELHDQTQQPVQLRVPWSDIDAEGISFLESIKPEREKLWAALCRVSVFQSRIVLYPLSLLSSGGSRGDRVYCPQFDGKRIESRNQSLLQRLRKKYGRGKSVQTRMSDEESQDEGEQSTVEMLDMSSALTGILLELDRISMTVLESGFDTLPPRECASVQQCTQWLSAMGINALAESARVLGDAQRPAAAALQLNYQLRLAREALVIASASPA